MCLIIDDGESLDDVLPKIVHIADHHPPDKDETARAWLRRMGPQIEKMNAQPWAAI